MTDFASALRAGEPVAGTWLSIGDPAVAEIAAGAGFDFAVVDTEHSSAGLENVENQLRAIEAADGDTVPLARVPWNDPVRIKRLLDTGPAGLLVPMVESAEAAREAVRAMRYPPEGIRGMATSRASDYTRGFVDYVESANDDLLTIVQIESERGVDNAADIAAVDGVDALFVGPSDLSGAVGTFPDTDDPEMVEAVEQVTAAAADAGVPVGTLTVDADEADTWLDRGMDFLVVGYDVAFVSDGADEALSTYRDALD